MSCQNQYLTVTHSQSSSYKKKQVSSLIINPDSVHSLSLTILKLNEISSLFLTQKPQVQLKFINQIRHKTALLWTHYLKSLSKKINKRCKSPLQYSVIEWTQVRAHLWSSLPLNSVIKSPNNNKVIQSPSINLWTRTMISTKV